MKFKGIPFYMKSHTDGVGRRTSLHQYAGRDTPYVQDLGRDADDFTIEGYVIQSEENEYDYFKNRDALKKAFRSFGPGILEHRYAGIRKVSVKGKARFTETFDQGGIARFNVSFVEAGSRLPDVVKESSSIVDKTVNVAQDLGGDFFEKQYNVSGVYNEE
jgi:prophage DNA circulation protein